MNRTFAMLTLLALAVVATPAQAISYNEVCHLPEGCEPLPLHSCPGILTVWMSPPDVTINQHCLPSSSPSSGEESAAAEGSADSSCAVLVVSTSSAADYNESCAMSWLGETQAVAVGMGEDATAEAPV